jgi:hypothetical protein
VKKMADLSGWSVDPVTGEIRCPPGSWDEYVKVRSSCSCSSAETDVFFTAGP